MFYAFMAIAVIAFLGSIASSFKHEFGVALSFQITGWVSWLAGIITYLVWH